MKKTIVKLMSFVALATVVESANAMQTIHADYAGMNQQQAKKAATQLRQVVDNSGLGNLVQLRPLITHGDATGTRELIKAALPGANLNGYINAFKTELKAATDAYIDGILVANNAFIETANMSLLGTIAAGPAVAALHNGVIVASLPGGAGPLRPATERKSDFKAALKAVIDLQTDVFLAALNVSNNALFGGVVGPVVAVPGNLKLKTLADTETAIKQSFTRAVYNWLDTIEDGTHPFLDAAVTNATGAIIHNGVADPAGRTRNDFAARIGEIIDSINL